MAAVAALQLLSRLYFWPAHREDKELPEGERGSCLSRAPAGQEGGDPGDSWLYAILRMHALPETRSTISESTAAQYTACTITSHFDPVDN